MTNERAPAPAATSANLWETEIGHQLRSDRQLLETLSARLLDSVRELQTDHRQRLDELQQAAVELALTIATRILHQRITANDYDVETMVHDMVAQLGDDVPVTIRLNPEDVALLERRLDGRTLFPNLESSPKIVADPSLGRGDGRIEGKETMWLSELAGQLAEMRDELLRSLGHAAGT